MKILPLLHLRSLVRGLVALALAGNFVRLLAAPVINEIMYRPGTGYPENTALEFIEIHNPDSTAVDLTGWAITRGVDFVFPAGTSIPPRGFIVVASDPAAIKAASTTAAAAMVLGPWKAGGRLATNGETITLAKPGSAGAWTTVDEVSYASEGDWATRTRDAQGGWVWSTGTDGNNRSLERRNPNLAKNNGQNWGESATAGGTPGASNSNRSDNIAPIISGVKHSPAVPKSTDPVTISLNLTDESTASALTASLHWRDATSTNAGAFQTVAMAGNGSGDFSAMLPPMADKAIVEFYVSASDGKFSRTWPASTSEGQNANCTYQVDNEVVAGTAPVYRLVLTAAENKAFEDAGGATTSDTSIPGPGGPIPGGGTFPGAGMPNPGGGTIPPGGGTLPGGMPPGGGTFPGGTTPGGGVIPGGGPGGFGNGMADRMFNVTLIVTRGEDTTIRYSASMRIRGNSSRSYAIKPLRISLPNDDRWDGISDFMINSRAAPLQLLAHRIQRAAGFIAADAAPIEVRRQGIEAAVNAGSTADYGQLVRVEEINGDYLDNHFPLATSAQIYRKVSVSNWAYTSATPPADPDTTWSGWSKQNNSAANDWSDVMKFTNVWQDTAAPYFSGGTAGNVAAGTWNGQPFSDADVAKLSAVTDLDYLARWLAVMIIMPNAEENLSTGEDDDYAAAFVSDGTRNRMVPIPHDMDTTFGLGENPVSATFRGIYDPTEILGAAGGFQDLQMKPLLPLLGDSTRPGNAAFRQKYLNAIRELFGSVFDADTTGTPNPAFYQFVDTHLAWTPDSYRTQIKTFMTERQKHLLGQIGAAKITPITAPTTIATLAATGSSALRINEVLAVNTTIPNGSTYPDMIELYNAGATAIDLAGKSLTDDPTNPRKYVFPSGTSIAAGGYLVIYADTETSSPGLHTGFALDAEGDQVRLYEATASGGALIDSVTFGFQIPNFSIARTQTNGATWALTAPTPGVVNAAAATLGNPGALKINEWAGRISFRVDHDFVELYNSAAQPVALGGIRLTDDATHYPKRFEFPALSFIAAGGFLPLFGADLSFGLDADFDLLWLQGANGATIDQIDFLAQPADQSTGRTTDGAATLAAFAVPTPGISNQTSLPAGYRALLAQLRISEIMYQPTASANAGDYEFIELVNIGTSTLDLSGVRFTNGLDYTFPAGTTLAGGAYLVVAKNRSAFNSRYPSAASRLAPAQYSGSLDNSGENIALTLPAPWSVHILKFRYESDWYPAASGGGNSLVARSAATTPARDFDKRSAWRASSSSNGSPGTADANAATVALAQATLFTVLAGSSQTLAVVATSDSSISYQWQILSNGAWTNVVGATAASYTVPTTSSTVSYRAIVTTNGSIIASDAVTLAVASSARLTNLSTRASSLTGANALVPGFVISGTGAKRLLIRNVGPTLSTLGVSGALADPQLTLKRYDSATSAYSDIASSDNWGTTSALTALTSTTASVGAFALTSNSADAALLVDLPAGQYSAVAGGVNNGTGIALLEIYDADSAGASPRLTNISTRGFVSTGADIMIAGFAISGEGSKTLLIRGVGPGLSSFGVSGALADPQLALYRGTELLQRNDDWSGSSTTGGPAAVATQVGAFALASGSKDAALVVTLPAGAYTVQISGVNNTTGIALVEIYDVP